jgi:hypothetical protein
MSGFYASNSRIRVLDTVGDVDETVFDTNEDMPHIVSTSYITDVEVEFSNLTQTANYDNYNSCKTIGFGFFIYYYFDCYSYTQCYSYYPEVICEPAEFCLFTSDYYDYYYCIGDNEYRYSIDAKEYSTNINIVDLPKDEDGNTIDVDFVIIQATGSRTVSGKDPRFNQTLVSTVPGKTFSLQGSMFLEGTGRTNGSSWLRRIMSVVVDNTAGKLKLKGQESVDTLYHPNVDTGFNNTATKSVFKFNFKVFFGRFKS